MPQLVFEQVFQGVAARVAVIEDGSEARFALVLRNHVRLDFTTALYHPSHGLCFKAQDRFDVRFEVCKKLCVCNNTILHHFGQAASKFSRIKGF